MKKSRFLIGAVAVAAFSMQLFAGCNRSGELTVNDMTVYTNGNPVAIEVNFSGGKEDIKYSYDDLVISIDDNGIVCYEEGEFVVTATTKSQTVEFTVTCKNAVDADGMYAWVGYPASEISPKINLPGGKAENVVYSYTGDVLSVNGNKITALKEGTAYVTATLDGYKSSFEVACKTVNRMQENAFYMWGDSWAWERKAVNGRALYDNSGTDGKTTVFIGDSFFDKDFFKKFNDFYGEYDALCLGIGGTTSRQWEMFFDSENTYYAGRFGQYEGIQPKNVVIQLGNNNIYNDKCTAKETAEDIQRCLTVMHAKMPDAKLYYFGVTPRNAMTAYVNTVKTSNARMEQWCANKDWAVYLDTSSEMTADKLTDSIHPAPEAYEIFVRALENAGMELVKK